MWKTKFVYVLNYSKTFMAVHKNNSQTHPPHQNKKSFVDDSCIFQSLYSPKVAGTIIALRLPSFTKNCVSGIKQKKWTPPLNSAYIHISLGTKFQLKLTILFFYFFWIKFAHKKGISSQKQKKWRLPLNSAYSN